MMFTIATAYRRAVAIIDAEMTDRIFSLLDGIKLTHIEGIPNGGQSNKGWLGTKMQTQSFDLVSYLFVLKKWK